jgi:hypothetical protein
MNRTPHSAAEFGTALAHELVLGGVAAACWMEGS